MLMNKLKGDCFIGHDTNFIVQILVKIQIFALVGGGGGGGGGGLVFDSSHLQEQIIVYTLVNCTIKLTCSTLLPSFYSVCLI